MALTLTALNVEAVERILTETSPLKLHEQATEIFAGLKLLGDMARTSPEDAVQALNIFFAQANFLETRAVYFLLKEKGGESREQTHL